MSGTDNRKQSLYFPEDMLDEIQREAKRQDRSISWIVQQAWRVARPEMKKRPSVNDVLPNETQQSAPPAPAPGPTHTTPMGSIGIGRPPGSK
jgi:uncharacterized small protein (TIGR04563 family)